MGEKTEQATPKKLRDAKRKGQVAKSQDFPAAFTFIVSIAATLASIPFFYDQLGGMIIACFKLINEPNKEQLITSLFGQAILSIAMCSIPVLVVTMFIGILTTFVSVGPVWAPEVFKFDIKKFNPVENIKAKFKVKTLVELLKSLFKVFVAAYIVYGIVRSGLDTITHTIGMPVLQACAVFAAFLKEVIIKVGLFFIVIAIFDISYQKHTFSKEMKMEKFEVKQEYKDTEGDPHIKSRRRQIAHEIAYQDNPASGAARAKGVVTNPTHLAIALDYEKTIDPCPFIIAMGQGPLAEEIIRVAEENKVPIIRNIPLAHKLWEDGKLFQYIPEETYEPVAEILHWIQSLQFENEMDTGAGT